MATIGSISVAFEADLKGLNTGVEGAIALFADLGDAAEALSKSLSSLSDAKVSIGVDSSGLDKAKSDVDALKKSASSKTTLTTAVESTQVSAATEQIESLGESVEKTAAATATARGVISQFVVTSARLSAVTLGVANSYREIRDGTLAYIAATTGAVTRSEQLAFVTSALRGEYTALRVLFAGVSQSIQAYVASFFSAEGAANLLRAALSGLLTSFGITDEALASSIKYFAEFSIQQASAAAAYRLAQRSIAALGSALESAGESAAKFIASSASLRAAGASAASSFGSLASVLGSINNAFEVTSARVGLALSRLNVAGPVSAAVGSAFDALRGRVDALAASSSGLVSSVSALLPSSAAVSAAFSRIASSAGPLLGVLGTVATTLTFVSEGSQATAGGFATLTARTAAVSAAVGAASGGLSALAAGTGVAAGATAGATAAVTSFASALPITAGLAIAAAVATGRFADKLAELGGEAEQVEQMADRFGAPREEVEKLRIAASNAGVGMTQLARGQQNLYSSLSKIKIGQLNVENVREAKLAFDRLGISMEQLKTQSPDQIFKTVAAELTKVEDPAKRTQIAIDLFGRQGAAILPALKEFGDLSNDFERLGGSISDIDFSRFSAVEQSFDRLKAGSKALETALLVPFTELQKSFNNALGEIKGGLAQALGPIASLIADATKPLAVVAEVAGRLAGILLRVAALFTTLASTLGVFSTIAQLFDGIQQGVFAALAPVEQLIAALQEAADVVASYLRPISGIFTAIGKAIGLVVGGLAQLVVYVALGAAAWGIYSAAVAVATGFSLAATVQFTAMWAAALGPFAIVIAGLAAIGAAIYVLTSAIAAGIEWLTGFLDALGLFGEPVPEINAATASIDELANAAKAASDAQTFGGKISESADQIRESVERARGGIGDLTIEAARFGAAGADAAAAAQEQFNELQQQLAKGEISLPTFDRESAKIRENLEKNIELLKDDSPEITLKKNLELYKQLDDAAKQAAKSTRDIAADVEIGDKIFPRSEEVKARAKEFEREYVAALEAIKKKQQGGDFARELTERRSQNEADFGAGKISRERFEMVKLELDTTSAQEQASIAAEDAQREFQRKKVKLEADLSFAESIRKELETAFLSPVEKFEKELKRIRENPELSVAEKQNAENNLRRSAREELIGKTAQTQFQERQRDIRQGVESKIISQEEADFQGQKALDDFAQAVGVAKTPFEEFSTSVEGLAEKFGFVGQPVDEVRRKLEKTPEQLALFDRALKESRDKLLQSLGVEQSPEQAFQEQMKRIEEAANAKDPEKRITEEQRQQAEAAARRRRDSALGAGAGMGEQFAERQAKINEAFGGGKDDARLRVANNALEIDQRRAAGLDATPAQQLQAGADKVADAFGVTGLSIEEIQKKLSPDQFAAYQEAIEKNAVAAKAAAGVEQTGAQKLAENRAKLDKALADEVITREERDRALKQQKDALLSSLGIPKSPAQDFEDAVAKIKENASELNPDEIAKGLKEAKDRLLDSLGIPDSPAKTAGEALERLGEAFRKGQISADELAKGTVQAKNALLQSLGIPLDPVVQLGQRMNDLREAFARGQITTEEFARGQEEARRAMLPGSEDESPVKAFQRDMDAINRAAQEGLIGQDEANQRRQVLRADLQENLKPALENLQQDRRQVGASDVRSRGGVDTFFRILQGRDNPSLKAQLEIARNTRILADAQNVPDAVDVIAQLAAR